MGLEKKVQHVVKLFGEWDSNIFGVVGMGEQVRCVGQMHSNLSGEYMLALGSVVSMLTNVWLGASCEMVVIVHQGRRL